MNAYELADDLENSNGLQYITKVGLVSLSAQMLRQQADRIAELEKEKIKAYDNGFEDGQKSLTSNHKELSDEEIIEIRDSCYVQSGIDEWEFDDVVFARAILKKASKK